MMSKGFLGLLTLSTAFFCSSAIKREELYPFGIQDDLLPSNLDDVSSPEIQLSLPIVFYENIYNSIFVNDNGILSFVTEVPSFFNAQFPLTYPIIAALYSDVDTRGTGKVYYRETKAPELLLRATEDIRRHFADGNTFQAQSLFIATWVAVGHFNEQTAATNTYQVIIASDGSQSYVFLLYPEKDIGWIQGEGKIQNLPDARAQAGFMSGDGRLYTLRGSGTDQTRNFDKMSNIHQPGVWLFKVGNTGSGGNVVPANGDGDRSGLSGDSESCATTENPCPPSAECIDYKKGFCCACSDGYFGNGRNCLVNNMPQRLNGKVTGVINEVLIDNVDLHAYIVTEDGRTYTAVSRIPPALGFDMQSLVTVGDVIGWLFAKTRSDLNNGFMLTGGLFNRTADIYFPQTGHHISLTEHFLGPDVFNYLRVNIEVRGTLPSIPFGSKIEVADYREEYTRASGGQLRSHSTRSYRLEGNSLEVPFTIDQTLSFQECTVRPEAQLQQTFRLEVSKNFIVYDDKEQIVRFAASYKTTLLNAADDPCREGKAQCGDRSTCVVDGDAFKCVCDRGYEPLYDQEVNGGKAACVDINECATGRHRCHLHAECLNVEGSFVCRCRPGYGGDGTFCQKELTCEELQCDPNGECLQNSNRIPECRCKAGFRGNGYFCQSIDAFVGYDDCRQQDICDVNADCLQDPNSEDYHCFCKPGYIGSGGYCVEDTGLCDIDCGSNGECAYNETADTYFCICQYGFSGDGYACVPQEGYQSCNIMNNCHPHAQCIYNMRKDSHECKCLDGFAGDGYQCLRSQYDHADCKVSDICSPNAQCVYNSREQRSMCRCNEGYAGNGIICSPTGECNAHEDCDTNAQCIYNSISQNFQCECNPGYNRIGHICKPDVDAPCNFVNNCHEQASCKFDIPSRQYKCDCKEGFKGDGKQCEPAIIPCNILNNCDVRAECTYSFAEQGFRCQCIEGYQGDGHSCRPMKPCNEDPYQCDINGECNFFNEIRAYGCQCRPGFVGDGMECKPAPKHDGDYLIFAQGMSLLRMPLNPDRTNRGQLILTKANQIPVGLDVDCLQGHIYWSDVSHRKIHRAPYNGSLVETILEEETGSPEGIAIDWVSRNIYWTDSSKDTIEVATLDGSRHKILIKEGLIDPRGIVVHPGYGKLYWSDWNRNAPKIESSYMDGTNRKPLVAGNLGLPNMLAIDYTTNDLCWTDAGLKRIECISLTGHNRRVIYTPAAYPFDLTVAGDSIYWTDWEIKFVQKVNKHGGEAEPLELPLGGNGKVYGIVTIPEQCPQMSNPCSVKNGGCKHLCLPNGRGGRTCACHDAPGGEEDCNEVR